MNEPEDFLRGIKHGRKQAYANAIACIQAEATEAGEADFIPITPTPQAQAGRYCSVCNSDECWCNGENTRPPSPARDAGAVAWGVVYDGQVRMASTSRKRAEEMEGDEPRDGSDIEHAYIVPLYTHPAAQVSLGDAELQAAFRYLRDKCMWPIEDVDYTDFRAALSSPDGLRKGEAT